jgi:hypothetical protein
MIALTLWTAALAASCRKVPPETTYGGSDNPVRTDSTNVVPKIPAGATNPVISPLTNEANPKEKLTRSSRK